LFAELFSVYVINSVIVDRSRNDAYLRLARLKFGTVVFLSARWLRFAKRFSTLYSSQASVCKSLVVGVDGLEVGFVSSEFVDARSTSHLLVDRDWLRLVRIS
jgi:hypothetical protein